MQGLGMADLENHEAGSCGANAPSRTASAAQVVDLTPYLRRLEQEMTERARREQPLIPASFPLGGAWHVIYCNIKCEFRANMGLKAKGFETFLPHIRKRIRHARFTQVVDRPLFPRYLFVRFDIERDEWFHPIKSTDGVEDLIRNDNIPVRIRDEQMAPIIAAQRSGDFDLTLKRNRRVVSDYDRDEVVRISAGPFTGFNATVLAAMPEKNRVDVMLEIMGRASTLHLQYDALEKI